MIDTLLIALGVYSLIGVIFAIFFLVFKIQIIDSVASASPLRFRLIIFPGCAGLWPLLLFKLFNSRDVNGRSRE
jgi:hypothetical protein